MAAAVMAVGCGKKSTSQDESTHNNMVGNASEYGNISDEDMPYGAKLVKMTPDADGVALSIEYDSRFTTADEAAKLAQYISSVGKSDAALMNEVLYPQFFEYMIVSSDAENADEYVQSQHDSFKSYIGGDYDFDYVIVQDQLDTTEMNFDYYDSEIMTADQSAQITDRKCYQVEILLSETGEPLSKFMNGQYANICVYTINGESYIVY